MSDYDKQVDDVVRDIMAGAFSGMAAVPGPLNCCYTTSDNKEVRLSLAALFEVMKQLPEPPTILVMDINIIRNDALPKNYIMVGTNVADALESAMKKEKTGCQTNKD